MSISFYLLFLLCISFQAWQLETLHLADHKFQKKLQAPSKGRLEKVVVSWDKQTIESMKLSPPKIEEEEELKKVSWRVHDDVDHNKVERNIGVVSSDYEQPKTYPPTHN